MKPSALMGFICPSVPLFAIVYNEDNNGKAGWNRRGLYTKCTVLVDGIGNIDPKMQWGFITAGS
jgi:hypothetical protein